LREKELLLSVAEGRVPACFRLLSSGAASVNACAREGDFKDCTPLHIACLKGHRDLVMALVDIFQASLVLLAPGGRSAAMCACEAGDEALAEWLIKEGVPADPRDDAQRTVLFYAAKHAMPKLTAWLLEKQNLPPGDKASDGSTPLAAPMPRWWHGSFWRPRPKSTRQTGQAGQRSTQLASSVRTLV